MSRIDDHAYSSSLCRALDRMLQITFHTGTVSGGSIACGPLEKTLITFCIGSFGPLAFLAPKWFGFDDFPESGGSCVDVALAVGRDCANEVARGGSLTTQSIMRTFAPFIESVSNTPCFGDTESPLAAGEPCSSTGPDDQCLNQYCRNTGWFTEYFCCPPENPPRPDQDTDGYQRGALTPGLTGTYCKYKCVNRAGYAVPCQRNNGTWSNIAPGRV